MTRCILASTLAAVFAVATGSAQSSPTIGPIRCDSCAVARQKPEPFDPAKNDVVPRVEPVFWPRPMGSTEPPTTFRMLFIARVLGTSPLRLEMLDSRAQQLDRTMAVVIDDRLGGRDPGTCGLDIWQSTAIGGDVARLLPTLRFNDLVTGAWMERSPLGRAVISELRKLTAPATWFHPVPATPNCRNRSGRLIVYQDRVGGLLTVYNDGGIQYAGRHGQAFARENLSAVELKELLTAFSEASFDTAPAVPVEAMIGSRLLLAAARWQLVMTDLPWPTLAPVIARLHLLRARALSSTRLILRTGVSRAVHPRDAQGAVDLMTALRASMDAINRGVLRPDGTRGEAPPNIDTMPEAAFLMGWSSYVWPANLGIRLADVPADGLPVPWATFDQHKLVFSGLLNAGFQGVRVIDGDRVYENVRLCQVGDDVIDRCAP